MPQLISHSSPDGYELDDAISAARARILNAPADLGTTAELNAELDTWAQCELGQWMLINQGWNAFWTRYCISYPDRVAGGEQEPSNEVERFFLSRSIQVVATQQRFRHFTRLLADYVLPGASALSVPCGVMDDLLATPCAADAGLLVGADLDPASLGLAAENAEERNLSDKVVLVEADAWNLKQPTSVRGNDAAFAELCATGFDVVTSNGLNIYVPDDDEVVDLYRSFREVTKTSGHLIISALTPPQDWDLAAVDADDLRRTQRLSLINDVKWANPRTASLTIEQLKAGGFDVVETHLDTARAFPTFLAVAA